MSRAYLNTLSGVASFLFSGALENDSRHAGFMIADLFKAHGVEFVFCLSGGHISPILVGSKSKGIKVIDVRHEVNAVFAADAVARVTGVPGVAIVTAGPGVTNTITAIKNAEMAESPLVLIGGSSPIMLKGQGALQDINQREVIEPIVKKCWSVTTVRDILPSLREAFQVAQSGTPGPVFVELPIDILYSYLFIASNTGLVLQKSKEEITEKDLPNVIIPSDHVPTGNNGSNKRTKPTKSEYLASLWPGAPVYLTKDKNDASSGGVFNDIANSASGNNGGAASLTGMVTEKVLQMYMRWLFVDGQTKVDVTPLPVTIPISPPEDVEKTAAFIMNSSRPLFIMGSQSMACVKKVDQMIASIESLGIPCFLGGRSRGVLGRNNPLHIRQNRSAALKQSDCVILVGAYADFRLNYGSSLPSTAKIVSINRNSAKLHLNSNMIWTPSLLSEGDPCHFLIELASKMKTNGKFEEWRKLLKENDIQKIQENHEQGQNPVYARWVNDADNKVGTKQVEMINPVKLLEAVDACLPENTILVADGGDFVGTAAKVLSPTKPLGWLDPGPYGTLGVGGGFALGVKLAKPEAEVWILWGDGALGYSVMEYDTYKRHGVNIIGLCGNDACWGQIERDQTTWLGDPVSNVLEYSPYEKIAQALGGEGLCVSSPKEDLQQYVQTVQNIAKSKPVLLNVLLGKSNFREGSISV
eukprot:g1409.t1